MSQSENCKLAYPGLYYIRKEMKNEEIGIALDSEMGSHLLLFLHPPPFLDPKEERGSQIDEPFIGLPPYVLSSF